MVRVGCMAYFHDYKWYDSLIDGELKERALILKAQIKGSWGDATTGVMKFCTWLRNSFENIHEIDYDVLDYRLQRPYANDKPKWTLDPYLNIVRTPKRDYETNNGGTIQEGQGYMENPTLEPSVCKIKKFKMKKYTFEANEEYVAIKELHHINHSETNIGSSFARWMMDAS
ncbi:hypothetical protein Tco_0951839 [Tanacetum coccineum]|uniref:Uncharacterized protein n=1 Tax=Tanacetum coccineum TaxID=301880 RepID=A0ABQ5E1A8_9ASTR